MSSAPTAQLRASALSVKAGPLWLLSGLSFTLEAGSGLILRGANGTGKTSLLRILAGLTRPEDGAISFGTSSDETAYSLSENCHFLGHKNGLKAAHTVRKNLSFFTQFQPQNAGDKNMIDKAAKALGLTPLLDLPVSVLSAGQARRVAFARLLMAPRLIWLLDEPAAALDAQSAKRAEKLCQEHLESGGIIIAATHGTFLSKTQNCRILNIMDYAPQSQGAASR